MPSDHFLIADGAPQDWIDHEGVRHIRLDRTHGDFGNVARSIGALLAAGERYDAVAFLDADNRIDPDHVARCLAAAQAAASDPSPPRRIDVMDMPRGGHAAILAAFEARAPRTTHSATARSPVSGWVKRRLCVGT